MSAAPAPEWRDERRYSGDKPADFRSPAQRDRDRVLYCAAFRRLGAVTQVVLAEDEGHLFHNRLTHSLKVAQVGRRIAEEFVNGASSDPTKEAIIDAWGGLNPDIVETAGLAHDLGHPPFGHIAEDELQRELTSRQVPESFEGNAQSFRIVAKLESIDHRFVGLNLTRASLNAILKYPWVGRTKSDNKWGAYPSEQADFDWARSGLGIGERELTLEAQLMDWADDITYAIHDVEDFYRAGFIPLHELKHQTDDELAYIYERVVRRLSTYKTKRLEPTSTQLHDAAEFVLRAFPLDRWTGSATQRAILNTWSSAMIAHYVEAGVLATDEGLHVPPMARVEIALLKELTKLFVVEAQSLATQQVGERRTIRVLFKAYLAALKRGGSDPSPDAARLTAAIFPPRMSDEVIALVERMAPLGECSRTVADTIAGMTEQQVIRLHRRLMGMDYGSFADPAEA